MEKRRTKLTKKGVYESKIKRATQMLLYKRHQKPGVKGWELRKALGSDYPKVLEVLDDHLEALDLEVKTVYEEDIKPSQKPAEEELDKARYYITLRGDANPKEKMIGWRIDDLAGLSITISYIVANKGQASRKDVEKLLSEKMPNWKIGLNVDRYIRYGYLMQDDKGLLFLDWRTRAEVDEKALLNMLLNAKEGAETEVSQEPEREESEEQ
jgi:hypothetical protein